jgi:hypothetical protein
MLAIRRWRPGLSLLVQAKSHECHPMASEVANRLPAAMHGIEDAKRGGRFGYLAAQVMPARFALGSWVSLA